MKNPDHKDKEILLNRQESMRLENQSLKAGYYIDGELKQFIETEVLESLYANVPEDFSLMPKELADIKYPYIYRPMCILTNTDLSVNINFNVLTNNLGNATMKQATNQVKTSLVNEQGAFNFSVVKMLKDVDGCYFEFSQKVVDGDLYHLMANVKIKDNIYQLTFNCLYENHLDWKPAVLQIWETLKYEKKGA